MFLTSIPSRMFFECRNLSPSLLSLPNYCAAIGERAFFGCNSLKGILDLNNVETIGDYAIFG